VAMKLYVGNLSYNVSSSDLEQLFAQYGAVRSAQVITDRDTGRSKGFGFVEMSNQSEANKAKEALSNTEFEGRTLNIDEARPPKSRGDRDRDRGQNRGRRRF